MNSRVSLLLFSSRFNVAIAAMHGGYMRIKVRKDSALAVVKKSVNGALFVRTLRVETTVSFAMMPVANAAVLIQLANPNGANNGVIQFAM